MSKYFITRYFYPDESSGNTLLLKLTKELSKKVDNICVITSNRTSKSNIQLVNEENYHNIRIIRLKTLSPKNQSLLVRLFDYGLFLTSIFSYILFKLKRDDLVVSMSDPPLLSVIAGISCHLRGITQIQWVQDIYPEIAKSIGMKIPFSSFLIKLRNWSMKKASISIVISSEMANYFSSLGINNKKIRVIPNWTNESAIFPILKEDNKYYEQFITGNKFIIGYSGNIGLLHDFNILLNSTKELSNKNDIEFLFIGSGSRKKEIVNFKKINSLNNINIHPFQKEEILNYTLNIPDIHIVTLLERVSPFAYPSKLYGAMATGKPIIFIGGKDCEIFNFIEENKIGFSIENHDINKLILAINTLYKNKDLREIMSINSRKNFLKYYTFTIAYNKWVNTLKDHY